MSARDLSPEELAQIIDEWANAHAWNDEDIVTFAKSLVNTHPTILQVIMGMFLQFTYEMSSRERLKHDRRASGSWDISMEIRDILESRDLIWKNRVELPYI